MRNFDKRLRKLEQTTPGLGRCPRCWGRQEVFGVSPPTLTASAYLALAGQVPDPERPAESAPCPACGWEPEEDHGVQLIIVSSRAEILALEALWAKDADTP